MAPFSRVGSRSTLINKIFVMVSGARVGRTITGRRVVVGEGSREAVVVKVTVRADPGPDSVTAGIGVVVKTLVGESASVATTVAAKVAVMVGRGVRVGGGVGVLSAEHAVLMRMITIKTRE